MKSKRNVPTRAKLMHSGKKNTQLAFEHTVNASSLKFSARCETYLHSTFHVSCTCVYPPWLLSLSRIVCCSAVSNVILRMHNLSHFMNFAIKGTTTLTFSQASLPLYLQNICCATPPPPRHPGLTHNYDSTFTYCIARRSKN